MVNRYLGFRGRQEPRIPPSQHNLTLALEKKNQPPEQINQPPHPCTRRQLFCFCKRQGTCCSFTFAIHPPSRIERATRSTSRDSSPTPTCNSDHNKPRILKSMKLRSGTVASAGKDDMSSPEPSEPELLLRRSTRLQRSQSARPSETPQPSRKPKRTVSESNPTPQASRGKPPTRSSGLRPQQVSGLGAQELPLDNPARRVSPENTNMEQFANSPGGSPQYLPGESSGTAMATTSDQPAQELQPLHSVAYVTDNFQTVSVFQHSCGPEMAEERPLPVLLPPVLMPKRSGPKSLLRADVS